MNKPAAVYLKIDYKLYQKYKKELKKHGIKISGKDGGLFEINKEIFEQGLIKYLCDLTEV